MTRTQDSQDKIEAAMEKRPKLQITETEGRDSNGNVVKLHNWKAGDIVSLSPRQRKHAIDSGWAVPHKAKAEAK